jgi:hypothetical protein
VAKALATWRKTKPDYLFSSMFMDTFYKAGEV